MGDEIVQALWKHRGRLYPPGRGFKSLPGSQSLHPDKSTFWDINASPFSVGRFRLSSLDNVLRLSYNRHMVVFDASTLILLARTEVLEVLILNFPGQVLIPEKVREEVLVKDSEESPQITAMIRGKRIGVLRVDRRLLQKLMEDFNIDLGEAEAIT